MSKGAGRSPDQHAGTPALAPDDPARPISPSAVAGMGVEPAIWRWSAASCRIERRWQSPPAPGAVASRLLHQPGDTMRVRIDDAVVEGRLSVPGEGTCRSRSGRNQRVAAGGC